METYSTLASAFTVLSLVVFIAIVFWAYSARRKLSFDAAANEPFALPDEAGECRAVPKSPSPSLSPAGGGQRNESLRDSRSTGARP
jgi:cbb3-type cytochrome oxidase subunit 3